MSATLSKKPTYSIDAPESVRQKTDGCWTGWIADMEVIKNVNRKSTPETYLCVYPRNRASGLNTWLFRFGLYSNGMFFELDRYGSVLVKDLIKHSQNDKGYYVRIDGKRNGDKIKVSSITEIPQAEAPDPNAHKISQSQLRGEFARMGI